MNAKRGYVPEDERNFSPEAIFTMQTASRHIRYLINEGYDLKQASTFVGNHYMLSERQRLALMRSAATDEQLAARREKEVRLCGLAGREVWIDGFNTIITLEVILSDSIFFQCMDGTVRDLAALRGTYRLIPETDRAVHVLLGLLEEAKADTDTSTFAGYPMEKNEDGNWEVVVNLPEAVQGGQCVKYFFVTYDADGAGHNSEFGYYTYNAPKTAPEKTVAEMEAAGYTLVWSDEFDGDTLDLSKWDYQIGNGLTASNNAGWGNQEAEYYTDSTDNVYVQDGNLHITALKQDTTDPAEGTFHYTSGRLRTTSDVNGQLFATRYGRVEARMILPTEEGAWPAFWMLPQDQYIYNGWAASGEIDIMEAYGDKPKLFGGTIHFGSQWPNNIYKGKSYTVDDTTDVSVYHTYGIEWEPGKITWFVDDEEYYTADTWYSITAGTAENNTFDAPFDVPFYILLNVAVNGTWDAGEADNGDYTGNGNSSMLVDYVRVYSKNDVD